EVLDQLPPRVAGREGGAPIRLDEVDRRRSLGSEEPPRNSSPPARLPLRGADHRDLPPIERLGAHELERVRAVEGVDGAADRPVLARAAEVAIEAEVPDPLHALEGTLLAHPGEEARARERFLARAAADLRAEAIRERPGVHGSAGAVVLAGERQRVGAS